MWTVLRGENGVGLQQGQRQHQVNYSGISEVSISRFKNERNNRKKKASLGSQMSPRF